MAKREKTPNTSGMGRFALIKEKIKAVFNLIRLTRIILRHLEACLSEIFALSGEEISAQLSPPVDFTESSEPDTPREVILG